MTIYFYKVDQPYGYFSNFSLHPIYLDSPTGKTWWPTVEHYYQAQKFLGSDFAYLMTKIQAAPTPEAAAALGRLSAHLPHSSWPERKLTVMYTAVNQKFRSYTELQSLLVATDKTEIIEDSPVDAFWGCGLDRSGHNHLGKIIMQVRQEIWQEITANT
jgi:N-glycosidase YbiA